MTQLLARRGLLGAFLAAPVIITTPGLLMPVKKVCIDNVYVGSVLDGTFVWPLKGVPLMPDTYFRITFRGQDGTLHVSVFETDSRGLSGPWRRIS